jgi:hypothetical protein
MPLVGDSEVQDFWSAVADAGYSNYDFELSEIEDSQPTSGIYALRGKAIVRRKSTSVTRQYSAGHATAWVADFEVELRGGAYGPA